MLLWSKLRTASVVHHTRQCGILATAFTRHPPVQARSHAHFRLRFRCGLVSVMAKAHGVADIPTLNKNDFAQDLNLKALKVQAKQCQSLLKKFAG